MGPKDSYNDQMSTRAFNVYPMIALLCLAALTAMCVGATSVNPTHRAYLVSDSARIIESLDIEDRTRQRVILQLLEDYDRDWTVAQKTYDSTNTEALHVGTPASRAAKAHLDSARSKKNEAWSTYRATRLRSPSDSELQKARDAIDEATKALDHARNAFYAAPRRNPDLLARAEGQMQLRRNQLADVLEANLLMILSTEEASHWVDVRADLQRRRLLARGELSGECIHLEDLLARLSPPLTTEQELSVTPLIVQWKHDIDRRLAKRSIAQAGINSFSNTYQASETTNPEFISVLQSRLATQRAVRDTTLLAVDQIAEALHSETSGRLRRHLRSEAFAYLLKPSAVSVAIDTLDGGKDDGSEAEALEALAHSHAQRLSPLYDLWVEATLEYQGLGPILDATANHPQAAAEAHRSEAAWNRAKRHHDEAVLADWTTLQSIVGRSRAAQARGRTPLPKIKTPTK